MPLSPLAIHNRVLELWSNHFTSPPPQVKLEAFIEKVKIFDQVSANIAAILFSYHHFEIHYANAAASYYFGMSPDEIMGNGFPQLIACIDNEQNEVALKVAESVAAHMPTATRELLLKETYNTYVNWKINGKNGYQHRVLAHIFPAMVDENNQPQLALYLLYDMKPFLHPGKWWCRSKIGSRLTYYNSETREHKTGDILSPRELEVLLLLEKGMSSKSIAQTLNLSSNTVDNHRRNMLLRTGAMDTSSLVQVCKLCRILQPPQ
jgi:DNA-binding CsgD family transcriptional regulator